MNGVNDKIIEEAAAWHLASSGDAMDWDGFTSWLEADPRHRAAFDEIALADAVLGEHPGALQQAFGANDDFAGEGAPVVTRRRWFGWAGGAIAASLAVLLAVQQLGGPQSESYETAGASQMIALADGSQIELAPRSRLEIEGSHQEHMALEGGAWFDIRHDPSRMLAISAGGVEISDIGTKFDVQAAAGQVRVQVAEGEVKVSSEAMAQPVRLTQGRGLTFDPKGGTVTVKPLTLADIGNWRQGRLTFDAAPLPLVAADLSRYAGVKVTVADQLRNRHFTGTLVIGDGETALRDLSQLMGLELGRSGDGYRLEPHAR